MLQRYPKDKKKRKITSIKKNSDNMDNMLNKNQ